MLLASQGEVERLNNILVSFPTTEDDDAALLGSENLTDWRERVIVKFRMLRKRALRLTIQVIHTSQSSCVLSAYYDVCCRFGWTENTKCSAL